MTEKESLLKSSEKIRKGLLTNNLDLIKKYYSSEFRGYSVRGEDEPFDLILQMYKPGVVNLEVFEIEEQTAEVIGEVGIIRGKGYLKGYFGEYLFEHYLSFTDIYIRSEGLWKCYRSHGSEIQKTGLN